MTGVCCSVCVDHWALYLTFFWGAQWCRRRPMSIHHFWFQLPKKKGCSWLVLSQVGRWHRLKATLKQQALYNARTFFQSQPIWLEYWRQEHEKRIPLPLQGYSYSSKSQSLPRPSEPELPVTAPAGGSKGKVVRRRETRHCHTYTWH